MCTLAEHLLANGVVIMDMSVVSPKNRPLISKIAEHQIDEVIDIITAKEEGRLFIPPCEVGDIVNVKILSVDLNKKRISLTMKDI